MRAIYLAVIVAYDVTVGATTTLYFATSKFVSGSADTPAHTFFDPRLAQPIDIRRDMFASGTTRGPSRVSAGSLILNNEDGELDDLASFGFDGRDITIYRGEEDAAFPAGFTIVLDGTMQDVDFTRGRVRFRVRDNQEVLNQVYQTTKYAGDNALPAGLEGVTDLEGKPKPVALGLVRNVSAVLVNSSKLIYQVNDGAVDSVQVYDNGIPLFSDYTNVAEVDGTGGDINVGFYGEDTSGNTRLTFGGDDGNTRQYNGTTWSAGPTEFGVGDHIYAGAMGDADDGTDWAGFVLAGAGGTLFTYVQFGVSGTSRTSQFGATAIRAAIYWKENTRWVIVGDAGKISTSDDGGQTWTSRTSGTANALYALAVSQTGVLVAVGAAGTVISSVDGTTWVVGVSGADTSDLRSVTYGRGMYVAVGADDKVIWSFDGLVWALATGALTKSGLTGTPLARWIAFIDGRFVVVGEEESIETSNDAITWFLDARVGSSADDFHSLAQYTPSLETFIGGFDASQATIDQPDGPLAIGSEADLLDDSLAPQRGSYGVYATGGYFRLGSPPAGQVTADVTQGAAAGDRTAGQLWTDVLVSAGFSASDWNTTDITDLDTDNSTVCGHWSGLDDMTFSAVLSAFAESVGAWWGVDRLGKYRIQVLKDPQLETNLFTFPRALDNAAWTKTRSSITADDLVAPNGLVEMDELVEDGTASSTHFLERDIPGTLGDNTVVTISFAAVANTRDEIRCSITGKDGTVNSGFIDLTDGSVGTLSGASVRVVSDRGTFRVFVSADIASGGTTPSFAIHLSSGSETISYNGDGTSGVHLWDVRRQTDVALSIEATDMVKPWLTRVPAALPTFKNTVKYQKNYTVQNTGLAGGVSDVRRGVLANESLETASTDSAVQTLYLLAREELVTTLMDTTAGATSEAARLQALRGVRRELFALTIPLDDDSDELDLGDYIEIVHPRFQLAPGKEFVVMTVDPDAKAETLSLEVWG